MARTHFTIVGSPVRDGRVIKFVADYRDGSAGGPIVGRQTFTCPVAGTRAAQELLMAAAVRDEVQTEDAAVAAPALVPPNTTLAIAAPARTQLEQDIETFMRQYERRQKILVAKSAGITIDATQESNQLTALNNAWNALPAGTGRLDLL